MMRTARRNGSVSQDKVHILHWTAIVGELTLLVHVVGKQEWSMAPQLRMGLLRAGLRNIHLLSHHHPVKAFPSL